MPEGGYYVPHFDNELSEFVNLKMDGALVSNKRLLERAATKRRLQGVLDVGSMTRQELFKLIAGESIPKGSPVRLVHDYARDMVAVEPGPEIFSSKEELCRSLF